MTKPTCVHPLVMPQFSMSAKFSCTACKRAATKQKTLKENVCEGVEASLQMCGRSPKTHELVVLKLVGFQLVPLVEALSAALMVTLEEREEKQASTQQTPTLRSPTLKSISCT